jgi:hypothetical protein
MVLANSGVADAVRASTSFWRASIPVLVAFHTYAAKRLSEFWNPPDAFDMYKNEDVKPLRDAFRTSFLLTTIAHVTLFFFPPDLLNKISESSSSLQEYYSVMLLKDGDFALFALATALWCLYSVYELRRNGWATTKQALIAALAVIVGQVLVGPAAVYSGLWYWREGMWSQEANLQGRKDH